MQQKCIIVDDEHRAHIVLENYIKKFPLTTFVFSAYNVPDAYNYLRNNIVDIIFLDIKMPESDGFSLLNLLGNTPATIITTAYLDYAFQSYEYGVVDYLHKPIMFERFIQSVEKAIKWNEANRNNVKWAVISVKAGNVQLKINSVDILYIESLRNYVKIYCKDRIIIATATTKEMEDKLQNVSFARIHKSYIVNLSEAILSSNGFVKLGNVQLPIGNIYKKHVEHLFGL